MSTADGSFDTLSIEDIGIIFAVSKNVVCRWVEAGLLKASGKRGPVKGFTWAQVMKFATEQRLELLPEPDFAVEIRGVTPITTPYGKVQYRAQIDHAKKRVHIGYFNTADEAARAYDAKARELHGSKAKLNFPGAA